MGIFSKVAKQQQEEQVEQPIQKEQVQQPKKEKSTGVDLTIEEFEYLFNLIKNAVVMC